MKKKEVKVLKEILNTLLGSDFKESLREIIKTEILESQEKKEVFSTKEAAEFFGINPRTLESYRAKGLNFSKVGKRVFYTKENLTNFLHANSTAA